MAALVRELKPVLMKTPIIYGIRHAESWHNILFPKIKSKAYTDYQDTTLTANGMRQASQALVPNPDLILVSPLLRTLQTATIMWPDRKMVALECLKEYPQHTMLCNKRSNKSFLEKTFPNVDFSDLKTEEQVWPSDITPLENVNEIKHFLFQQDVAEIAIVTHSTWLKFYIRRELSGLPELNHCMPYILKLDED